MAERGAGWPKGAPSLLGVARIREQIDEFINADHLVTEQPISEVADDEVVRRGHGW
jgi:hypothetical protein